MDANFLRQRIEKRIDEFYKNHPNLKIKEILVSDNNLQKLRELQKFELKHTLIYIYIRNIKIHLSHSLTYNKNDYTVVIINNINERFKYKLLTDEEFLIQDIIK